MLETQSTAALWWAVVVSGIYHGVNPGMGWPLTVSAALMERRRAALFGALGALGAGHFVAMLIVLVPLSAMTMLVAWQEQIRFGAGILVIAVGLFLLVYRRHPRFLSRVSPRRLALWSFLVATAHGAALMLVPIYLGLCTGDELDSGHQAAYALMSANTIQALLVAGLHTLAMVVAGGFVAVTVYYWLGLKFLSKSWFNLDVIWAVSLIAVGVLAITLDM